MTIRKAGKKDVSELTALAVETYVDAFGHTLSPSDLTAHLETHLSEACFSRAVKEDTILLAFMDDRMIGFVQFGAVKQPVGSRSNADSELRRIYVHSEFRNRGVGKRLMDAALADMQCSGAADVYLDVWEHNDAARRFYQDYGFEVIGSHRFAVASGVETSRDLIMVRRRSP